MSNVIIEVLESLKDLESADSWTLALLDDMGFFEDDERYSDF